MAEAGMPKNIAQWTGFAVTMIIVLGRDADVLTAVPLGIAAGMLATVFQAAMRIQLWPARLAPLPLIRPPRLYSRGRHLLPQGEKDAIGESCTAITEQTPPPLWERVRRVYPGAGE